MHDRPDRRLGVRYEFGALREAIVGITQGIRIPSWDPNMVAKLRDVLPAREVEFMLQGQGQELASHAPEMYAALTEQIEGLVTTLEQRGVIVHRPRPLTASEHLFPGTGQSGGSLIYVRDPILVVHDYVIDLAMRFSFRRRQRFGLRAIVESRLPGSDACFVSMPEPRPAPEEGGAEHEAFLEGGDVLINGDEIYVGLSGHASSRNGALWLQRLLGPDVNVQTVRLTNSLEHLDCALSLPRPGLAIACPSALADGLPAGLKDWDVIEVTLDEAKHLACNGLVLDSKRYVMDRTHQRIAEQLDRKGVEVIAIPYELPARFGGGLRCSHHPLLRD